MTQSMRQRVIPLGVAVTTLATSTFAFQCYSKPLASSCQKLLHHLSFSNSASSNTRNPSYTRTLSTSPLSMEFDKEYPGTAVERLKNVRARVATLSEEDLSGNWEDVRRNLLWAGGL